MRCSKARERAKLEKRECKDKTRQETTEEPKKGGNQETDKTDNSEDTDPPQTRKTRQLTKTRQA
jgi:hypothetical protein